MVMKLLCNQKESILVDMYIYQAIQHCCRSEDVLWGSHLGSRMQ